MVATNKARKKKVSTNHDKTTDTNTADTADNRKHPDLETIKSCIQQKCKSCDKEEEKAFYIFEWQGKNLQNARKAGWLWIKKQ